MLTLPIESTLPELTAAHAGAGAALLQAPPVGKTLRVPLALLDRP